MNNRIGLEAVTVDGTRVKGKPHKGGGHKGKPAGPRKKGGKPDRTGRWAGAGVGLSLVLSAVLNGFAFSQHAPSPAAGWLLGVTVPALVLILSRVAGGSHRAGRIGVSRCAAGSGAGLLLLSVWHCAESIALLTGGPVALAVPMALAVDGGLVACELAWEGSR